MEESFSCYPWLDSVLVHVPVSDIGVYSDVVLPLQEVGDVIYLVILDLGGIFDVLAPLTTLVETLALSLVSSELLHAHKTVQCVFNLPCRDHA